jgi:HK97 family phage prohead protease
VISASFPNKSRADGWPGVVCRYNHDDEFLLGTTRSGTLRLSIDETGLNYDVSVPECRNDVLEMVSRGDVAHSSFAFQVFEGDWGMSDQGYPLRTLISGRLIDVAPVREPAYPDSTVGLRSLAKHLGVPYRTSRSCRKRTSCGNFSSAPTGGRCPAPKPRLGSGRKPTPPALCRAHRGRSASGC